MRCPHCQTGITGPGADRMQICPVCLKDMSAAAENPWETASTIIGMAGGLVIAILFANVVATYLGWNVWLTGIVLYIASGMMIAMPLIEIGKRLK